MEALVAFFVAAIGLASGSLQLWGEYVKRRDRLFPSSPESSPVPTPIQKQEHEDRILLRFDETKKDQPGSFEHFVSSLSAPLKPGYQATFTMAPSATLADARTAIGFCYIAAGYAGATVLIVLLIPLVTGAAADTPLRYSLMLVVVLLLCAIGSRPLWRISQNAEAAIRAANIYRAYIVAEKIQIAREFTQAKSRFLERSITNDARRDEG